MARREPEADDIASFYLRPVDGRPLCRYRPGQYMSVRVPVPQLGGLLQCRQFSLSTAPADTMAEYRVSVKREPLDEVDGAGADQTGVNGANPVDGVEGAGANRTSANGANPVDALAGGRVMGLISNMLHDSYAVDDHIGVSPPHGEFFDAAAPPPAARALAPGNIGLATILFQALYQPLKARVGNLGTYRLALVGIALSALLMPWVGYLDGDDARGPRWGLDSGPAWLYAKLSLVLILKNVCTIGGLERHAPGAHAHVDVPLDFADPPDHKLGPVARQPRHPQRRRPDAVRPRPQHRAPALRRPLHPRRPRPPKGDALAWSVFGGLALVGCVASLRLRRGARERRLGRRRRGLPRRPCLSEPGYEWNDGMNHASWIKLEHTVLVHQHI